MNGQTKRKEKLILFYLTKYFYWLLLVLILIFIILFYFLVFQPELSRGATINPFEYNRKLKYLESLRQEDREINKLLSDYQNIQSSDLKLLEAVLPTNVDLPNLIVQLNTLANDNGLSLSSFSFIDSADKDKKESAKSSDTGQSSVAPKVENAPKELRKVDISLSLTGGDYHSLKSFVSETESNLRLLDIVSLNFNPKGGGFSVNLLTYYYQ